MFRKVIKYLFKEKSKGHIDSTLKKTYFFPKFKKEKLELQLYKIVDYILIYLILILLPNQILSNYIEIKVNETKNQQILSDEFTGPFPSIIYLNNVQKTYVGKIIQEDFEFSSVKLVWNNRISNFDKMFSNIKNITEVYIYSLIDKESKFSYTFSNCINLKKFTIDISYGIKYAILDMSGMFYNCSSLTSFSFINLYLDYSGNQCNY